MKTYTCFKCSGTFIDLTLTNRKYSFKNTTSYETRLNDHHHVILTMLKSTFQQKEPKCLIYRDHKTFMWSWGSITELNRLIRCIWQLFMYSSLNKHAPKKKKVLQGNEKPHMNKYLRRAIMKRSKLKKVANKTKNLLDIMNHKNNVIMWHN